MSISPAAWSAIATVFAAIATVMMWVIQRNSLRESVRPQLVITEWYRDQSGDRDVIGFRGIRNVGSGAALRVSVDSTSIDDGSLEYVMSTERIQVIASGDEESVDCSIRICWKNIPFNEKGAKLKVVKIKMTFWDTLDTTHVVEYDLLAMAMDSKGIMLSDLLPNVSLGFRRSKTETLFVRRWKLRAMRISFLKRFIKII